MAFYMIRLKTQESNYHVAVSDSIHVTWISLLLYPFQNFPFSRLKIWIEASAETDRGTTHPKKKFVFYTKFEFKIL